MDNDEQIPMHEQLRTKKKDNPKPVKKKKLPPVKVEEPEIETVPSDAPKIQQRNGILTEQKQALIKRTEEKQVDIKGDNIKWIREQITDAEDNVKFTYQLNKLPKEEAKETLLFCRVKVLKSVKAKKLFDDEFLFKYWPKEMKHIKDNKFPYKWMTNDKKIMAMFRKHKCLIPMFNYMHNTARDATKEDRKRMALLSDHTPIIKEKIVTDKAGNKKTKTNKWPVSCFIANKKFYKKMASMIKVSEITVKRIIGALTRLGILEIVNSFNHGVRVLSFGYYVPFKKGYKHVHNATAKVHKESLRNFSVTKQKVT